MKKILVSLIIGFALFSITAWAEDMNLIYGEKHAFSVLTPNGWSKDPQAAQTSGLPYLIRPDNNLDRFMAYIYCVGYDRAEDSDEDYDAFIKNDINNYRKNYPNIRIDQVNLKFQNISGRYSVCEFSGFDNTYKETVVYIEFPEGVGVLVFSATTKEVYENYSKDFSAFAESFKFMANRVYVEDLNQ